MEGSFVKKPNPFLLILMFLLMATAGCHHKPVKAVILIPSTDNALPSAHAEAGGVLEFKMDETTPPNSTFQVQFSQQICNPNDSLQGTNTQPVICHVIANSGDYNVTIVETIGGTKTSHGRTVPPKELQLYVEPCKNCGH